MKILLALLGIPKSVWVNFRSLPLWQAIRLPIIVSPLTKIVSTHGVIEINGIIRTGMIKFGLSGFGLAVNDPCVIQNNGILRFNGRASFGGGVGVTTNPLGTVEFGCDFVATGRCIIVASKNIQFGRDCLVAWNTQFMDSDLHSLVAESTKNENRDIKIGNHVWLCSNVSVNKGSRIPSGCVIGSNTLLTKQFSTENCLIAGMPAKILKERIVWEK